LSLSPVRVYAGLATSKPEAVSLAGFLHLACQACGPCVSAGVPLDYPSRLRFQQASGTRRTAQSGASPDMPWNRASRRRQELGGTLSRNHRQAHWGTLPRFDCLCSAGSRSPLRNRRESSSTNTGWRRRSSASSRMRRRRMREWSRKEIQFSCINLISE